MDWIERIPPWFWIALVTFSVVMGAVAYMILLERKVASWTQDRVGPNRVGPWGLFQPLADGMKFLFKEDFRPAGVDRKLFTLAPMLMIGVIIVSVAVIPWGGIKQGSRTVSVAAGQTPAAAAETSIPWGTTLIDVQPRGNGTVQATYRYPFQIASLNIGVLFIIAFLSLAVYGVVIGGWASNNKFSFLGGLRAAAQMISYEIPLGLALLCVLVMFGTLDLGVIVERQAHQWLGFIPAWNELPSVAEATQATAHQWLGFIPAWNVFAQPLPFLLFLVCIHAEANRLPFDLAEAEQELVGGYHTEYSSMRFALFFLAEYAGMITTSAVCVAVFFGGWHLPYITEGSVDPNHPAFTTSLGLALLRALVFFTKVMLIIFVFMWTRWSLPRFRFDQLMMLAWRAMIPLSLGLLVMTALVLYFVGPHSPSYMEHRLISGWMALALLVANGILLAAAMLVSVLLPAPPPTNRRLPLVGSRFQNTPVPTGT